MAKDKAPEAPKYSTQELMANAGALFGCRPEVLAGALHGLGKAELTVEQAKARIDKFLKRRTS